MSLRYIESWEVWTSHNGDESVVLLNVTPCTLVNWYQHFARALCLLFQVTQKRVVSALQWCTLHRSSGRSKKFWLFHNYSEDGEYRLHQNAGTCLQVSKSWIPTRRKSLSSNYIPYYISPDRLCGLVVRVSGYRYRGLGFDSRRCQIFWVVVGLEQGPLSLVRSTEELLE